MKLYVIEYKNTGPVGSYDYAPTFDRDENYTFVSPIKKKLFNTLKQMKEIYPSPQFKWRIAIYTRNEEK